MVYRRDGDDNLLVEYGEPMLDLACGCGSTRCSEALEAEGLAGVIDLTPGIRSLQVHYRRGAARARSTARRLLQRVEDELPAGARAARAVPHRAPAAVLGRPGDAAGDRALHDRRARRRALVPVEHRVHPPHQRPRLRRRRPPTSSSTPATWSSASATSTSARRSPRPLDPRHRLVTTKYNPARTWTPENAVGIGGAYLCIYGMEGPGGYQFVGRTVQVWNRFARDPAVRRAAVAAAVLRPDRVVPGQRRGAARPARGRPTRARARRGHRRRVRLGDLHAVPGGASAGHRRVPGAAGGRVRGGAGTLAGGGRVRPRPTAPAGASGRARRSRCRTGRRDCVRRRSPPSVWQVRGTAGRPVAQGDKLAVAGGDEDGDGPSPRPHDGTVAGALRPAGAQVDGRAQVLAPRCCADDGHGRGEAAERRGGQRRRAGPRRVRRDRARPTGRRSGSRCGPRATPWPRRQRSTPGSPPARPAAGRPGRSRSRTTSTWPACRRPPAARRSPTGRRDDATAVARLRAAGAIVLGKTNLDQFATGLVGTRSPYGAVAQRLRPGADLRRVELRARRSPSRSASSTSRSAPTPPAPAGCRPRSTASSASSRPAALVPTTGVVPACRSLDCVTVFARRLTCAQAGDRRHGRPGRPGTRWRPCSALARAAPGGCPRAAARPRSPSRGRRQLDGLADGWARGVRGGGGAPARPPAPAIAEVDIAPLLDGRPRCSTTGRSSPSGTRRSARTSPRTRTGRRRTWTRSSPDHPRGARRTAAELFADQETLDRARARRPRAVSAGFDALLTPRRPAHPTFAEVAADPVGVNARLGPVHQLRNLLDLAAVAVPAGTGRRAAVRGHAHRPGAQRRRGSPRSPRALRPGTGRAARRRRAPVRPAAEPRAARGGRRPGRPARRPRRPTGCTPWPPARQARPGPAAQGGASIAGEVWRLPGGRLRAVHGRPRRADGDRPRPPRRRPRTSSASCCEPAALAGATDITGYGGWRAWLKRG